MTALARPSPRSPWLRRILVALGILALLGAGGAAYVVVKVRRHIAERTPRPLPASGPARLEQDVAAEVAWAQRTLRDSYDKVGLRNPAWDAEARRFLDVGVPWAIAGWVEWNAFEGAQIAAAGQRVVALGCDDPLVLAITGQALLHSEPESGEGLHLLQRSIEQFRITTYPRAAFRMAASWLTDSYRAWGDTRLPALVEQEVAWLEDAMADGSYRAGDDDIATSHVMAMRSFRDQPDRIAKSVESALWTSPWMKRLVSGRRHEHLAWAARGSGFSNEVKEEAWPIVQAEMRAARADYLAAYELDPTDSRAASRMADVVDVAPEEGDLPARVWFDRAVARVFDAQMPYMTMTQRLRQRWSGSDEELLAFARECLDTGRFDTQVPRTAWRVIRTLDEDRRERDAAAPSIYRDREVYGLLVRTFQGYLARPGISEVTQRWQHAAWAVAADRAGRYGEANQHLVAAGGRLHRNLPGLLDPPEDVARRISAFASPVGARIIEADSAYQDRAFERSRGLLEAVKPDVTGTAAAPFVHDRLAILDAHRALAAGAALTLVPRDPQLAGWEAPLGTFQAGAAGSPLQALSGGRGMVLRTPAVVGPAFEAMVDAQLVWSSTGEYQFGLAAGELDCCEGRYLNVRVRRFYNRSGELVMSLRRSSDLRVPLSALPDRFGLALQVWNGRASAWIDGLPVLIGEPLPAEVELTDEARLGLASWHEQNVYRVDVHRLEARRLLSVPGPGVPFATHR
jgi:hypothetical protein